MDLHCRWKIAGHNPKNIQHMHWDHKDLSHQCVLAVARGFDHNLGAILTFAQSAILNNHAKVCVKALKLQELIYTHVFLVLYVM